MQNVDNVFVRTQQYPEHIPLVFYNKSTTKMFICIKTIHASIKYLFQHFDLDCGELTVPNGSFNNTSTTCGTTRVLTCDPCFDLHGNGVAFCEFHETWTFDSECVVKGNYRKMLTTTTIWFHSVDIRFLLPKIVNCMLVWF